MNYKPPYIISDRILNLVVDITMLLSKVDGIFKNDVHLRKRNQIKTVVGTLAIEGNNLDIKQVTAILEGKKVIGNQKEIQEVKSAIKAYEFIHPFVDGNGRMGRFWQSLILSKYNPIFSSFPIESIIKQRQNEYYKTLSTCDREANSTLFIEFMLECIYAAISSEISSDKSSEINSQSTDETILEFLKLNPKATIKILASKLNLTTRAIEKQLANLKKENKLQRVGSAKKGEWLVNEEGNL